MIGTAFLANLFSFPPEVHDLFPPCPIERIHEEERVLGKLPDDLRAMLRRFNGGALFIKSIELLTVFGFWMPYKKAGFEFQEEAGWFIERFTARWRSGVGQPTDWIIGITNYRALSRSSAQIRWYASGIQANGNGSLIQPHVASMNGPRTYWQRAKSTLRRPDETLA